MARGTTQHVALEHRARVEEAADVRLVEDDVGAGTSPEAIAQKTQVIARD